MADLVRQVEVGCAQRGRSLALTWNLQTACTEAALSESPTLSLMSASTSAIGLSTCYDQQKWSPVNSLNAVAIES